jgi:hypothetical protein
MARELAARARFVGEGKTRGRLIDLGPYPGLLEATGAGKWVRGEVFELPESGFLVAELDRYEGCPWLYERVLAQVILEDEQVVSAWLYRYRGK